jgi:hypothetical protein
MVVATSTIMVGMEVLVEVLLETGTLLQHRLAHQDKATLAVLV